MKGQDGCICIDDDRMQETIARLTEHFSRELGRDLPAEVVSRSVSAWLERRMDRFSEDLYEMLSTPRNEEARELRRIIDDAFLKSSALRPEAPSRAEETADVFTGRRSFSFEKLAAMTAYIVHRAADLYKTKLNKLLFYADFTHYLRTGTAISGARYLHLPYGPVPDGYERVIETLSKAGTIWFEQRGDAQLIGGRRDPIIEKLTVEETETLDRILDRLGTMTSTELTRLSHQEKGYRSTKLGEAIAYEYAKFSDITREA
jgi:uncharacterized phage-associated protein